MGDAGGYRQRIEDSVTQKEQATEIESATERRHEPHVLLLPSPAAPPCPAPRCRRMLRLLAPPKYRMIRRRAFRNALPAAAGVRRLFASAT